MSLPITIVEVKNCQYAVEDKSKIRCEAKFEGVWLAPEINGEFVSFLATPNDTAEHGRDIYNNAVNGDYGIVKDYEHPPLEDELREIRNIRLGLLKDCDWTVGEDSPLSADKKAEWKTYRQELRDLTNGIDTAAKARAVVFPTNPDGVSQ
jgi:hypothetical protein